MASDYEDNYKDYSTTKMDNGSGDFIKKLLIIAGAIIFVLLIIGVIVIVVFSRPAPEKVPIVNDGGSLNNTATGTGVLPSDDFDHNSNNLDISTSTTSKKAESLLFADFYKSIDSNLNFKTSSYELPINSKSDVLNYYSISKKIDLDPYLDSINNKGGAILPNVYSKDSNDFYSVYGKLSSEEIPIFVTSDFILYYYQNTLKRSFKEIEKSVFYENLWDITKKFYEISSTRYKKDFAEKGIVNDPVLEGEKLESSYFAVMLELLKPTSNQINRKANFTDETKFSEQEGGEFDYVLLDYLKKDVLAEVKLIRNGKDTEKSPVLFYEKDYHDYDIPADYSGNAKLNNFYLVTKWMNSVFPIYFQNEQCPDCLLDKEDWRISLAASNLIARDFEENQDLKNEWASIYKIISFFSGLRQDLSYLHFYNVFINTFPDRSIEDVFARSNETWDLDYTKYQNAILGIKFSELEGSFNRNDGSLKKKIGMRMLQENYWPNDYIFSSLTGEEMNPITSSKDEPQRFTTCDNKKTRSKIRCIATGMDIINLIYPLDNNDYYLSNTEYSNFAEAQKSIDDKLAKFTKYSWQNNIYWSTLNTLGVFLNTPKQSLPVFMRSDIWQDKDLNTALGAWVNLHLPADEFSLNNTRVSSSLSFGNECNIYNYIEPNISFVNELIAKTDMLSDMLVALGLAEKTNVVSFDLKELKDNLISIKDIIGKELNNDLLEKNDCEFVEEFTRVYNVDNFGKKEFLTKFDTGFRSRESIDGIKLVAVVKTFRDNKVLIVGPIFNYKESH